MRVILMSLTFDCRIGILANLSTVWGIIYICSETLEEKRGIIGCGKKNLEVRHLSPCLLSVKSHWCLDVFYIQEASFVTCISSRSSDSIGFTCKTAVEVYFSL